MQRRAEQGPFVGELDDPSEVHHRDAMADVLHYRQIMGDEQVGQPELVLQVHQEIDHLRLDGDVESRDRLVPGDEVGAEHQRPRDADALALAARELMGIVVDLLRAKSHPLEDRGDPLSFFAAGGEPVDRQWLPHDVARAHAGVE